MRQLWYSMTFIYLYFLIISIGMLDKTGAIVSVSAMVVSSIFAFRSRE